MFNDAAEGKSSGYKIYTVEKIDQERNRVYLKDYLVCRFPFMGSIGADNLAGKDTTASIQAERMGHVGSREEEVVVEIQRNVLETVEIGPIVERQLARSRKQGRPFVSYPNVWSYETDRAASTSGRSE